MTLSPETLAGRKKRLTELWLDTQKCDFGLELHRYTDNIQRLADYRERYSYNREFIEKSSDFPGLYVPVYLPWYGVTFVPEFFGCRPIQSGPDVQPWTQPAIYDNPEDVYRIKIPTPVDTPIFQTLRTEIEFVRRTDPELPVRLHAISGPLDTCCQIWKEDRFYLAMYDHPVEVEHLLDVVTQGIIEIIKAQLEMIAEPVALTWPMVWAPLQAGVGISEDQLAVCSPGLYQKYVLKHLNRISRAFNGLTIHSCGNFEHNLPNLAQVENLNGLNFSICQNGSFQQGTRIEQVVKHLPDTVLLPAFTFEGQDRFASHAEVARHMLDVALGKTPVLLSVDAGRIDEPEINALIKEVAHHGVGI